MRKLITSLALVLSALSSYAITPLWMRDARISPDGSEIVFCYKGDIYKVPAQGGTAVQPKIDILYSIGSKKEPGLASLSRVGSAFNSSNGVHPDSRQPTIVPPNKMFLMLFFI